MGLLSWLGKVVVGISYATKFLSSISEDPTLTKFNLWTNQNQFYAQELVFNNRQSVESSNFNATKPTVVIAHGLGDHGKVGWILSMKREFLKKGTKFPC